MGKHIGQLLKKMREDNDLSQSQMARILGFSSQFYGRVEKGEVGLPIKAAKKLMKDQDRPWHIRQAMNYDHDLWLRSKGL